MRSSLISCIFSLIKRQRDIAEESLCLLLLDRTTRRLNSAEPNLRALAKNILFSGNQHFALCSCLALECADITIFTPSLGARISSMTIAKMRMDRPNCVRKSTRGVNFVSRKKKKKRDETLERLRKAKDSEK